MINLKVKIYETMNNEQFFLCRNYTLSEAWITLKRVHRRAQPNDGFARVFSDLDRKQHGNVLMEWQHRRPVMKVCPICGENAGLVVVL